MRIRNTPLYSHQRPSRRTALRAIVISAVVATCAGLYFGFGPFQTHAAVTFVVSNVNDSGPGSLRQAILDANANPGADTITFNITGPARRIQPQLGLPDITDTVVIDGSTQPGFAGAPIVELNGGLSAVRGLFVDAPGSTIRGLVINGFNTGGIVIGISGTGSRIQGCYIGTDVTGKIAIPNGGPGVRVLSSDNVIGGTTASARNVISGNSEAGVDVRFNCCPSGNFSMGGNVIQGNYIGVTATGDADLGNLREGVVFSTSSGDAPHFSGLVGGTAPGAGNVISGNGFDGILIGSFNTRNITVQGNRIGTNATGTFAIPNDGDGVRIDISSDNLIGGSAPGAGNLISGNGRGESGTGRGAGIRVGSSGNIIQGNLIGTNATGTGSLRNLENGITAVGTRNTIGGTGAGEGNVIAFNGANGVQIFGANFIQNSIRGNSIHSNGTSGSPFNPGMGIDLGAVGPNANDAGDTDMGPNFLQNFPIIASVTAGAGTTNVKGSLNSSASKPFSLDFFRNSACDTSAHGEGEHLIGSTTVTTDASGNATFDVTFSVSISQTELVTATATDEIGNTSEFSPCATTVGTVGVSIGDVAALEGNSGSKSFSFPVTLQSAATQEVTVTFNTQDGTALAPANDYVANLGTVKIPAGQTSTNIVVQVTGDPAVEDDEVFFVKLTAATNASILDSQATGTILNDDEIRLILEESGPAIDQAAALDWVLFLRDPFRVVNPLNWLSGSANPNTAVVVFAENLILPFFEAPSAVGVTLVDSNNQTFSLSAEQVSPVTVSGLNASQVVFRLPNGLAPGTCTVKLVYKGKVSNTATIRIVP